MVSPVEKDAPTSIAHAETTASVAFASTSGILRMVAMSAGTSASRENEFDLLESVQHKLHVFHGCAHKKGPSVARPFVLSKITSPRQRVGLPPGEGGLAGIRAFHCRQSSGRAAVGTRATKETIP